MTRKQENRQIKRTKQGFKHALIALVTQKDFDSITVTDITKHADYNRATFYTHYNNKEELLIEMMDELTNGLVQFLHNTDDQQKTEPILEIFNYVKEHASMFNVLLGEKKCSEYFIPYFTEALTNCFSKKMKKIEEKNECYTGEHDVYVSYLSSSIIGIITFWINKGMEHSPQYMADQMKIIFNRFPSKIILRANEQKGDKPQQKIVK